MLSTLHPNFLSSANEALEKRFNDKLKKLEKMFIMTRNGHSLCYSAKTLLFYLGPEKLNISDYIEKNTTSKMTAETIEQQVDTLASNAFLKATNEKYLKRKREGLALPDVRDLCLNKANKHEIACNNNILDLFTLENRRRHHGDKFTVSINKYFNLDFNGIPAYVLRVFKESQWKDVQLTLGRALVDYKSKPIIFFYGTGSNSKTSLVKLLDLTLQKLFTSVPYDRYKVILDDIKKRSLRFGATLTPSVLFSFLGSRIVAIDDVDLDRLVTDAKNGKLFPDCANHTLICCVEKKPTEEDIEILNRPCYVIEFPYKFTLEPNGEDERICLVNRHAISPMLSWVLLGAHQFLKQEANTKCEGIISTYKKHICEICRDEDGEPEDEKRESLIKIITNWL